MCSCMHSLCVLYISDSATSSLSIIPSMELKFCDHIINSFWGSFVSVTVTNHLVQFCHFGDKYHNYVLTLTTFQGNRAEVNAGGIPILGVPISHNCTQGLTQGHISTGFVSDVSLCPPI